MFVPSKDPEALAEAIIRLDSETTMAGALARRAARYEAFYTEGRMESAYRELYLSLK